MNFVPIIMTGAVVLACGKLMMSPDPENLSPLYHMAAFGVKSLFVGLGVMAIGYISFAAVALVFVQHILSGRSFPDGDYGPHLMFGAGIVGISSIIGLIVYYS